MASRASLIQSRSIYVGTSNAVAPSDGNLIVTGNVGIGTTSPDTPLFVQGGPAGTGSWNRTATLSATYPGLIFNSNGTKWGGMAYDYSAAMRFWVNASNNDIFAGTLAMSILNNGNVGIGTTSPSTKLDVIGVGAFGTMTSSRGLYSNGLSIQNNTGEATSLFIWQSGVASAHIGSPANSTSLYIVNSYNTGLITDPNSIVLTNTGNVGIGTTNPNEKLQVAGNINAYVNGGIDAGLFASTSAGSTTIALRSNGITHFNGGNVGIGTTSPAANLHIQGSNAKLRLTGDTYTSIELEDGGTGDPGYLKTYHYGSLVAQVGAGGTFFDTGNVGIGTNSPAYKLQVDGSTGVRNGSFYIGDESGSTNSAVEFYKSGTTIRMYTNTGAFGGTYGATSASLTLYSGSAYSTLINGNGDSYFNAGYIGIGTTSPSTKLHVFTTSNSDQELLRLTVAPANSSGAKPKAILGFYTPAEANTQDYTSGRITSKFDISGYANSRVTIESLDSGGNFIETLTAKNGNVGIGTTSPSYKLDVNVASNSDALRIQQAGTSKFILTGDGVMTWGSSAANGVLTWDTNIVYIGGLTNNALGLRTNGSEKVRITTGGDVGIGTTAPNYKLDVNGSINIYSGNSLRWGSGDVEILNSGYSMLFSTYTGSALTEKMRITSAGNVGIGTTSPSEKLHVVGSTVTVGTSYLFSNTNASYYNSGANDLFHQFESYWDTNSASSIATYRFDVGTWRLWSLGTGSAVVTAKSNGNVGIGTTAPIDKLQVSGSLFVTDKIYNGSTNDSAGITFPSSTTRIDGFNGITFHASSTNVGSQSERMRITAAGNVGIGTAAPQVKLEVRGAQDNTIVPANAVAKFVGGDAGIFVGNLAGTPNYGAWLQAMRESDGLVFPLHLQPNGGNVGIGTNSPAQKLHVVGNGLYTGNLDVGHSVSTEDAAINLGTGRTGNGFAYIDLIGDTTYTDYGLRILRNNGGANTTSLIVHRGTGDFSIQNNEAANLVFLTAASERMRITSAGNVGIGTASPAEKLHVAGKVRVGDYIKISSSTNYMGQLGFNRNTEDGTIYNSSYGAHQVQNYNGTLEFQVYDSSGTYVTQHNMFANGNLSLGGNVGIGTTSPTYKLQVEGTSYFTAEQTISYTDAIQTMNGGTGFGLFRIYGNSNAVELQMDAHSSNSGAATIGTYSNSDVYMKTNNTSRMVVKASGNVGIGTTSPGAKLQIGGGNNDTEILRLSVIYDVSRSSRGGVNWHDTTNTTGRIYTEYDGSMVSMVFGSLYNSGYNSNNLMIIRGNGNVGIGTTSPIYKLQVAGSAYVNGGTLFIDSGNFLMWGNSAQGIRGVNDTSLEFTVGSSERMRITSTGNVGIGTTSPTSLLTVTTATNAVDVLRLNNTGGDSGSVQGVTHLAINHFNSGTNPSTRITAYQDSTSGWPGGMYFSTRSLNTDSAPVERMRITSGGNVGIGTTSPQYMLDVNGDAQINAEGTGPAYAYVPDGGFGVDNLLTSGTENVALGKPDIWLRIHVDGVAFVFPGYQEP